MVQTFFIALLPPATDVDVIYTSLRSRGERRLFFPQFLDGLAAIAARKFPDVPVPEALRSLLELHLFPIHANLANKTAKAEPRRPSPARLARREPVSGTADSDVRSSSPQESRPAHPPPTSNDITGRRSPLRSRTRSPPRSVTPVLHATGLHTRGNADHNVGGGERRSPPHDRTKSPNPADTSLEQAVRERCRHAEAEAERLRDELFVLTAVHDTDLHRSKETVRSAMVAADERLRVANSEHAAELDKCRTELVASMAAHSTLRQDMAEREQSHVVALSALHADLAAARSAHKSCEEALQATEKRALDAEVRNSEIAASLQALLIDSVNATAEGKGSWDQAIASFSARISESECARAAAEHRANSLDRMSAHTAATAVDAAVTALRADAAKVSEAYLQAESRAAQASIQLATAERRHAEVVAGLGAEIAARHQCGRESAAAQAAAEVRAESLKRELANLGMQLEQSRAREVTLRAEVERLQFSHAETLNHELSSLESQLELGRTREFSLRAELERAQATHAETLKRESASLGAQLEMSRVGETALRAEVDRLQAAIEARATYAATAELADCQAELIAALREHEELSVALSSSLAEQRRLATRVEDLEARVAGHAERESNFEGELEALHLATITGSLESADANRSAAEARIAALQNEALVLRSRVEELEKLLAASQRSLDEEFERSRHSLDEEKQRSRECAAELEVTRRAASASAMQAAAATTHADLLKQLLRESADALRSHDLSHLDQGGGASPRPKQGDIATTAIDLVALPVGTGGAPSGAGQAAAIMPLASERNSTGSGSGSVGVSASASASADIGSGTFVVSPRSAFAPLTPGPLHITAALVLPRSAAQSQARGAPN